MCCHWAKSFIYCVYSHSVYFGDLFTRRDFGDFTRSRARKKRWPSDEDDHVFVGRISSRTYICLTSTYLLRDFYFPPSLSRRVASRISTLLCIISGRVMAQFIIPDSNGNIDPEAPPSNYGRRRSRAVLYQLSGHYKQDNKHKIKLNNVRLFTSCDIWLPSRARRGLNRWNVQ